MTLCCREKHGIVRKDFLDNLMELRREGELLDDLSQGNTPTARITEPKFSKFMTNASEPNNPFMHSISGL
jgi:hypothetical protein